MDYIKQIPINTSKSRNFIKNTENTDFIIIPEYRLENSQQINTISTIINTKQTLPVVNTVIWQ